MNHPRILVVDLRHDARDPSTLSRFDTRCVVASAEGSTDVCHALATGDFDAVCFEYDFPDITSLMLLKEIKIAHPSIPVLMITRAHSEALAVWAFRTGIWDYFVDPVPVCEVRACLDTLAELKLREPGGRRRKVFARSCSLPSEVRFRDTSELMTDIALDRASEYIERNLSRKFTQADAARACKMSTWQFSRQFKKCFSMTFQDYIQQRRILEATRLLKHPSASVTDVCFAVGFVDPSYFSRVFRNNTGVSPSGYKAQLGHAQSR